MSENEKFEVHVEELRKDNVKLTLDNNKLQIDFEAGQKQLVFIFARNNR